MNRIEKMEPNLPAHDKSPAAEWQRNFDAQACPDKVIRNRSGLEVQPLYWPEEGTDPNYDNKLGFPGAGPMTRGIYASMHRGRTWTQRQLIGLGRPEDFNLRIKTILKSEASALSIIPCNSVYRGLDCDEIELEILGTCGTVINTEEDLDICLTDIPIDKISIGLNDPNPFTMLAQMLVVAENRGIDWTKITGTSNQSDYISHFVANHMFYRLSLTGARRVQLGYDRISRRACSQLEPALGCWSAHAAGRCNPGAGDGAGFVLGDPICQRLYRARYGPE